MPGMSFFGGRNIVGLTLGLTNTTSPTTLSVPIPFSYIYIYCILFMHGYIFQSAFFPDPYWSPGSHQSQRNVSFSPRIPCVSFLLPRYVRGRRRRRNNKTIIKIKKGIPLSISSVNPPPQSTPADVNWKICWPCFVAPSFPPRLARCQLSIVYCLSRGWRTYSVGVSPLLFVPDVLIDCSAHSASMS